MYDVPGVVLRDSIMDEINGRDYKYGQEDKVVLEKIYRELHDCLDVNVHYLAELDLCTFKGAGFIIDKYISEIPSQSVRGYLLPHMVYDKVPDCDLKTLRLYLDFRASDAYISKPGEPAPAHIYVRFDNAFRKLKAKRIRDDLISLAKNARDACYLPFTMQMLASWKRPEMKEILKRYLTITIEDLQNEGRGVPYGSRPNAESIKRDLTFVAIGGLKYYPTPDVIEDLQKYTLSQDEDIRKAAIKVLGKIHEKNL